MQLSNMNAPAPQQLLRKNQPSAHKNMNALRFFEGRFLKPLTPAPRTKLAWYHAPINTDKHEHNQSNGNKKPTDITRKVIIYASTDAAERKNQ